MRLILGQTELLHVSTNGVLKYGKLPVDKARELDPVQLYGLLFDGNILEEDTLHCVIEDLRSVHGSSASSNFSYGFNNGSVVTFLKAYQIPFTRIFSKTVAKADVARSSLDSKN